MNLRRLYLVAPALALLLAGPVRAEYSPLWGVAGEKWTPASRLPDFSYAGYRRGEEAYRLPAGSSSVADYGAKGDGRTDDTAAFKQAIAAGQGKVIRIPPGRFILSDRLEIRASNLVLRGAGADQTYLVFTKSLETLEPRPVLNDGGTPTSDWSWAGGLIMIGDHTPRDRVGDRDSVAVSAPAPRGANRLTVDQAGFKVGDEIVLTVHDTADKSLLKYLYHGQTGNITGLKNWQCREIFRVRAVSGGELTLDRGLRFEVRPEWHPTLKPFRPAVTDVGVDSLTFDFPATPYLGHFKEVGWNPVAIRASAAHCWLKDLVIHNGDNGPFIEGAAFCTIEGLRETADPQRRNKSGLTGHHGITLEGLDCLCTRFSIEREFVHDLTVQSALGCVFAQGRALNLCMDHHCWASYENLFTDLDAGAGSRLFQCGGGSDRGLHTAAGATFWNIRARAESHWPKGFGPDEINLIGLPISDPPVQTPQGRWLETYPAGHLLPANLYASMLARRLVNAGH